VNLVIDSAMLVDVVLAMTALEAVALLVWRGRTGAGIRAADLLPNLAAGAFLILGVRLAIDGHAWYAIAPCMLASLGAHLVDLARRWQAAPDVPGRAP
jgi:hypothetical protein